MACHQKLLIGRSAHLAGGQQPWAAPRDAANAARAGVGTQAGSSPQDRIRCCTQSARDLQVQISLFLAVLYLLLLSWRLQSTTAPTSYIHIRTESENA